MPKNDNRFLVLLLFVHYWLLLAANKKLEKILPKTVYPLWLSQICHEDRNQRTAFCSDVLILAVIKIIDLSQHGICRCCGSNHTFFP